MYRLTEPITHSVILNTSYIMNVLYECKQGFSETYLVLYCFVPAIGDALKGCFTPILTP